MKNQGHRERIPADVTVRIPALGESDHRHLDAATGTTEWRITASSRNEMTCNVNIVTAECVQCGRTRRRITREPNLLGRMLKAVAAAVRPPEIAVPNPR